jgi:hypothetical protein
MSAILILSAVAVLVRLLLGPPDTGTDVQMGFVWALPAIMTGLSTLGGYMANRSAQNRMEQQAQQSQQGYQAMNAIEPYRMAFRGTLMTGLLRGLGIDVPEFDASRMFQNWQQYAGYGAPGIYPGSSAWGMIPGLMTGLQQLYDPNYGQNLSATHPYQGNPNIMSFTPQARS